MKKIRSYTSIWSVEKVLYSINDFKLPLPITFTQMAWFVVSVFAVMLLGNLPPLSFIDGAFLKYFGVPFALHAAHGLAYANLLQGRVALAFRPEADS